MNNLPRKIGLTVFLLVMLAVIGAGFYVGMILLDQNRLRVLIEAEVRKTIGQSVAIGKVKLGFREGLIVDLNSIQMGNKERLFLSVGHIKAKLSILNLIRGEKGIQGLYLSRPQLFVRLENMTDVASQSAAAVPVIEMEDGTITALFRNTELTFSNVNGRLDEQNLRLVARYQGAETQCFVRRMASGWRGEININDLQIHALDSRVGGTTDLDMQVDLGRHGISLSTNMRAREVVFPGGGTPMRELNSQLKATITENDLEFSDLMIQTPFIRISGKAHVSSPLDLEKLKRANLNLALSSNIFDYEELVRHLPMEYFPDWLTILLARQIRNGSMHFESIAYSGPLSAFNAQGDFFNRLAIEGELSGMSFGAGYSEDRITDIAAKVCTANGDLAFTNISGTIENSRMNTVDLLFPKILDPGSRVVVTVDMNLPAMYFTKAWRAGMYSEAGFHLLDPLARIEGGRISAKVVYRHGMEDGAPQIKGDVQLQDGGFTWGNRFFEHVSGNAVIPDFGKPADIHLAGLINGFPVSRLDLTLFELFGEPHYRFQLTAKQLPNANRFKLDGDSLILATGSGKGESYQGDVDIRVSGFDMLGKQYGLLDGEIQGTGKMNGRLWPEFRFDLTDASLQMPDGRIALEHHLQENGGDVSVLGSLAVYELVDGHPRPARPLKGHVNMNLAWAAGRPLTGQFHFREFALYYDDAITVLNGPISIQGETLSTAELNVLRKDTRYRVSGDYNTVPPARFTGEVAVQGLRISKKPGEASQLPEDLVAEAGLSFSDLMLYGIQFDTGTAKARLEDGRLKFYGAELNGKDGSIKGDLEISNFEPTRLDFSVDFRDQGVKNLLNTFYSGKSLIEGKLRLQGRLTGTSQLLNGLLSFSAQHGHTMKSSLVTKLFGALNVYKIIKSRGLNLEEKRFSYNNIQVNFTIKDSIAAFDDFYLDSDSIQLSAVGTYTINTHEIDALVGVQPLESLDRAVSAIPVIGWVLTGDGGKLIVVTLSITGTTDNPVINLAPVNRVSEPMADTLLRVLKLPEKLIQKPKELISGERK